MSDENAEGKGKKDGCLMLFFKFMAFAIVIAIVLFGLILGACFLSAPR